MTKKTAAEVEDKVHTLRSGGRPRPGVPLVSTSLLLVPESSFCFHLPKFLLKRPQAHMDVDGCQERRKVKRETC